MEKTELRDAFSEFKNLKNIDRPTMMGVLEDVFRTQLAKTYGSADNFDIIINIDKGDCEIYWNREVVEEVEDPNTQIALSEVNKDGDEYEIGETYATKVEMKDFGRRGILNIRQNLQGRIMDIEKANLYNKYTGKIGEIFTGEEFSQGRSTRHGPRKFSSSTRTVTSSGFRNQSRSPASTSRRTTQ